MRVLMIILGALLLVGGVYCMFAPIETYSALSWLIGIAMVAEGVGSIVMWSEWRKQGLASVWTLIGAIISIILGVFLLGSFAAQIVMDVFIAYMIAAWLIIGGIMRIVGAFVVRGALKQESASDAVQTSWVALLVLGFVIVILGILCFFNPLAIMATVGLLLGIAIVVVGAGLIAHGIRG